MKNIFKRKKIIASTDTEIDFDNIEPGAVIPINVLSAQWSQIYMDEMKRRVGNIKPHHIKCGICGKEIGLYYPDPDEFWGTSLLGDNYEKNLSEKDKNVYCPDCWNLKKLKE